jgi:hypothetical protein
MTIASKAGPVLAALGLAMLCACARATREIAPAIVDPTMFEGQSCIQLAYERARRSKALIFTGMAQDQVSEDDSTRTLGIPTPMGSVFEDDREPEIARLKGELHAVNARMRAMGCIPDYY